MIVSMIANTVRDSKKRRKPFTPSDFLPTEADERPQEWETLRDKSMAVFAMFGGRAAE
jgi:hypothetical protein